MIEFRHLPMFNRSSYYHYKLGCCVSSYAIDGDVQSFSLASGHFWLTYEVTDHNNNQQRTLTSTECQL